MRRAKPAAEGVRTGLEVLEQSGFKALRGKTVGLICNPTTVDRSLRHLADLMRGAEGLRLAALFGPEHGIRGEAQDMVEVAEVRDQRTGIVVRSLYGNTLESLSPAAEWLRGLDVLVFDIQDVGSRYYTYVNTMALCMRAAAKAKVAFCVLDRPNPIGGELVEGNLVRPGFESFVGMFPIPNRHGMSAGELARLFNAEHGIGCELTVIACEGWRRDQLADHSGLPWVPPSPNMPTVDTALVYPGMCLLEGTNVSEGRGCTRPFEVFGAPFLDPYALCEKLEAEKLPGVIFRPLFFTPTFHKHAGRSCGGAMIHVTDRGRFCSTLTGIAVLKAAREVGGPAFQWRTERYELVEDKPAIDLLCGNDEVRRRIDAGRPLSECVASFDEASRFLPVRAKYLLYD